MLHKRTRAICLLLIVLLCISFFTGCGIPKENKENANSDSSITPESTPSVTAQTPNAPSEAASVPKNINKQIVLGEPIATNRFEITIKNIEFSYDVLPDDTSGFYSHYEADSGHVYVHIDADIKNTGKQELSCDSLAEVTVDYNSGYKYTGQTIPESDSLGFTYAIITSINPLETLGVRFLVHCPEEVETSQNSVIVYLKIDNITYEYALR